jgi:hypothetical protein
MPELMHFSATRLLGRRTKGQSVFSCDVSLTSCTGYGVLFVECQSSTNSSHRMRILQFRYWLNSLVNSLISCPNVHIFVLLMANHFANFLMVLLSDATHLPLHTMTRPCRPTSHSLPGPYPTPARSMRSKRVSHPFFPRPDELWIMEPKSEGLETWRSIESFLGTLHLSNDPVVLRAVANQWRLRYEIPPVAQ